MAGYLLGRPSWSDEGFYPVKKRLLEGFDLGNNDAVLLVDIGGGIGHYTEQFRSKFPDAPGRLILQDLPVVLEQVQGLNPRIERMEHDFFTEQPVKGKFPMLSALHSYLSAWVANQRLVPRCTRLLHAFHPPRLAG